MTARRPIALLDLINSANLRAADIYGNPRVMITGLSTHAQRTARNEAFIAITGTSTDSHMMISEAVDAGAAALIVEKDTAPHPGVTVVRVPNTRFALGQLAQAYYGHPTRAMKVCGVTGTNGKTTSTHLIKSIMDRAGSRCGLIGTLGAKFLDRHIPLNTTTPGPLELAKILAAMEEDRVETVVMECSSHAIDQGRINGIPFRVGALLGVTQDHLDYHGTFENYVAVKKRLFYDYVGPTPGSVSCFNLDDAVGEELSQNYLGDHIGYSKNADRPCQVRAEGVKLSPKGTSFTLVIDEKRIPVESRLVGAFNVTNMLAAASCAYNLGADPWQIGDGLSQAPSVPGRFEFIDEGQEFSVIVDYAHTPDALERVLRTARRLSQQKVITVFGCGGDRDKSKRAKMGKAVGDYTDFAIITSDNPRTEDPGLIARMVLEGVLKSALKPNRSTIQLDRKLAIEQAILMAGPGDIVVIAGKGHEDYQDIGSKRIPFDDREAARLVLRQMLSVQITPIPFESVSEQLT